MASEGRGSLEDSGGKVKIREPSGGYIDKRASRGDRGGPRGGDPKSTGPTWYCMWSDPGLCLGKAKPGLGPVGLREGSWQRLSTSQVSPRFVMRRELVG